MSFKPDTLCSLPYKTILRYKKKSPRTRKILLGTYHNEIALAFL